MSTLEMPLESALVVLRSNAKLFGLSPLSESTVETAIAVLEYVAELEPQIAAAREAYESMVETGVSPDVARLVTLSALLVHGIELPGLKDEVLATCSDVLSQEAA